MVDYDPFLKRFFGNRALRACIDYHIRGLKFSSQGCAILALVFDRECDLIKHENKKSPDGKTASKSRKIHIKGLPERDLPEEFRGSCIFSLSTPWIKKLEFRGAAEWGLMVSLWVSRS